MEINNKSLNYFATINSETVLRELQSSETGLTHSVAAKRIKQYGKNIILTVKKRHIILEFLSHFTNPMILLLIFASFVSFLIGETVDSVIIIAIVIMSAGLNFYQEYKAGHAAEKLKEKIATHVTVIRESQKLEVKMADLCIGDIIFLSSGDLVPADARIIISKDLFVNQSSLTGESLPVEKIPERIESKNPSLSDIKNIVLSGSSIISGSGTAVIVKTGSETEFGEIASDLTGSQEESEFTKGIKDFSFLILRTTVLFVIFIFFFNSVIKHESVLHSFIFAVAVAVGLTPELLPMIMTVTIGKGALNMAKKGVIVKRLSAIPNLGSMDILCTDKTGTLTQDKIELVKYTDVYGNHSEKVLLYAYINSFFQTGIKNPLNEAVLNYKKIENHGFSKIDEIPFDFIRKKMSVVVEKDDHHYLITKGAAEEIFKSCSFYLHENQEIKLDKLMIEKITELYHKLSKDGYRVLAVGIKNLNILKTTYSSKDETEMELIGFIAFLDPAKKDVKEVLRELKLKGIEIKVITGDNELVTQKICADVGLEIKGVLLGLEMENLSDNALRILVEKTTIFARFTPNEKNRVILSLKQNNHVVGYLGDGVNDAPSLKTADVSISVDNAVDVAKETAELILTHKSLHHLLDGVLEGRRTFGNTMKYIMMGVSSNFGNMLSVLGAVIFIPYLPMLPIQILLNNFLYDLSQLTIPTDNVDRELVQAPKRWNMQFVSHFMLIFGSISSVYDFLTYFILYGILKANPSFFQTGWFLESLATQTLVIYIIRTRKIPYLESRPSIYLVFSTMLVTIFAWILPFTHLGAYFNFVKLPAFLLITLGVIVILYLITVSGVKRIFYHKYLF